MNIFNIQQLERPLVRAEWGPTALACLAKLLKFTNAQTAELIIAGFGSCLMVQVHGIRQMDKISFDQTCDQK